MKIAESSRIAVYSTWGVNVALLVSETDMEALAY